MKYTVNREKSEVTLSFTANEAEWKEAENKAYAQNRGRYSQTFINSRRGM